jgi:hypothetical protein
LDEIDMSDLRQKISLALLWEMNNKLNFLNLTLQSDSGEISGPHYENLEFHRVSIRVPTTGAKGVGFNDSLSSNVALQRQKKLNVDRKSTFLAAPSPRTSNVDGDVVDKQYQANVVDSKKFVKFGYSQHEVWNWLHQEDGNAIYVGKVLSNSMVINGFFIGVEVIKRVIGETEIRLFKWSNQIGFLIADSKTLLQ